METIKTANSTYEIDHATSRIRRVSGSSRPTHHFQPNGEWHTFTRVEKWDGCLYVFWPDEGYTVTSRMVESS